MSDDSVFEGFSLKSSGKSSKITTKNPAVDFAGALDHETRKLKSRDVSQRELAASHGRTAKAMKLGKRDISTPKARRDIMDEYRNREGVKSGSSLEQRANQEAYDAKGKVAEEFHRHVQHLLTKTGDEGHHMVRKLLADHLTPSVSMPCSKIHVKGDTPERSVATVTSLTDSPLRRILNDKKSRFAVTRSGHRTTIHHVDKDGKMTAVAHYTPKTKGNAFGENVHGWNVLPGDVH